MLDYNETVLPCSYFLRVFEVYNSDILMHISTLHLLCIYFASILHILYNYSASFLNLSFRLPNNDAAIFHLKNS